MLTYAIPFQPGTFTIFEPRQNHYAPQPGKPTLLNQVRAALRRRHYALRTEETYVKWIIRFIHFHKLKHPLQMDTPEIEDFLNYLAVDLKIAASTQNQAFSAILFLYNDVLQKELSAKVDALRAKTSQRLPTVLSQQETQALLAQLSDTNKLIAQVLYGCGLRLMEGLRLRVKDIDFEQAQIGSGPEKAIKTVSPFCQIAFASL